MPVRYDEHDTRRQQVEYYRALGGVEVFPNTYRTCARESKSTNTVTLHLHTSLSKLAKRKNILATIRWALRIKLAALSTFGSS